MAGVDPRIHFALNCGARSCPPVREFLDDDPGRVRLGYGRFDWSVAAPA